MHLVALAGLRHGVQQQFRGVPAERVHRLRPVQPRQQYAALDRGEQRRLISRAVERFRTPCNHLRAPCRSRSRPRARAASLESAPPRAATPSAMLARRERVRHEDRRPPQLPELRGLGALRGAIERAAGRHRSAGVRGRPAPRIARRAPRLRLLLDHRPSLLALHHDRRGDAAPDLHGRRDGADRFRDDGDRAALVRPGGHRRADLGARQHAAGAQADDRPRARRGAARVRHLPHPDGRVARPLHGIALDPAQGADARVVEPRGRLLLDPGDDDPPHARATGPRSWTTSRSPG